ncbi:DMT family transporter [Acuticoccus sp.]|uniref:DMT family transporter n=1 Tax=Acuticoccus sp. TaxID=1904378 RepID=UPI003B51DEDD
MERLLPLLPAIFVLLWSTGFVGARYAMPYAEPFTFLSMRYALAIAILAAVVLLVRAPLPAWRPAGHALVVGVLIHGVYLGGVFVAVDAGLNAGIAALVVSLQPILTTLLAAALLGEPATPRVFAGLGLGLAGVALVVAPKLGTGGGIVPWTLVPVATSAVAISVGSVWQKRFVGGVDLRAGTMLQYCGALVPTAVAAWALETRQVQWTGELMFALAWFVVVLSILAVLLMLFLIREGAVSRVASLLYLVPGLTAVMAWLMFRETLSAIQLAGLALACVGVAAATRQRAVPAVPKV